MLLLMVVTTTKVFWPQSQPPSSVPAEFNTLTVQVKELEKKLSALAQASELNLLKEQVTSLSEQVKKIPATDTSKLATQEAIDGVRKTLGEIPATVWQQIVDGVKVKGENGGKHLLALSPSEDGFLGIADVTEEEEEKKESLPTAITTDRPGFVQSPYGNPGQLVDVTGLPSGFEVKCPYTGKLFRVP